ILQALLETNGLSRDDYRDAFGTDVLEDVPQLQLLVEAGLAAVDDARVRLTEAGLERADVIGPWLYTAQITTRIKSSAGRLACPFSIAARWRAATTAATIVRSPSATTRGKPWRGTTWRCLASSTGSGRDLPTASRFY